MSEGCWYLRTDDGTVGPLVRDVLLEWVKVGGIQAGQKISRDTKEWVNAEDVPFLDMRFSIDAGVGPVAGPFNKSAAERLLAEGGFPEGARIVEVREPFSEESVDATDVGDDAVRSEDGVNVVEREVLREVRVEVPVEKIVEKVVVDDSRIQELEDRLKESIAHETDLKDELSAMGMARKAAEDRVASLDARLASASADMERLEAELRDAQTREESLRMELSTERSQRESETDRADGLGASLRESGSREASLRAELASVKARLEAENSALADEKDRVVAAKAETKAETARAAGIQAELDEARQSVSRLRDELAKLPMTIEEASKKEAFIQSMLKTEADDIGRRMEFERTEFEGFKKAYADRISRMIGLRREILKRMGTDPSQIPTTFALETSEAPQVAKLKKELDELRHAYETEKRESAIRLAALNDQQRKSGQRPPPSVVQAEPISRPPPVSMPNLGDGGKEVKLPHWMQFKG